MHASTLSLLVCLKTWILGTKLNSFGFTRQAFCRLSNLPSFCPVIFGQRKVKPDAGSPLLISLSLWWKHSIGNVGWGGREGWDPFLVSKDITTQKSVLLFNCRNLGLLSLSACPPASQGPWQERKKKLGCYISFSAFSGTTAMGPSVHRPPHKFRKCSEAAKLVTLRGKAPAILENVYAGPHTHQLTVTLHFFFFVSCPH